MNERNDASHLVRVLVYQLIQEGLDLQDIPEYVGYLCRRAVLQPSTDPGGVGEIIEASKEGQVRTDYELLWLVRACLKEVSLRVPDHIMTREGLPVQHGVEHRENTGEIHMERRNGDV